MFLPVRKNYKGRTTRVKSLKRPAEAIILAGGKGTRLKGICEDLPKPMMPVCGKPFIEYLLNMLINAGIKHTILAVGYKHDIIESYFGRAFKSMQLTYAVEESPLGTGGAVAGAMLRAESDDILVLNGDSYINVDIIDMFAYHVSKRGDITIALKYLHDCSRFGSVSVSDGQIVSFREKCEGNAGYINGGAYIVNQRISADVPFGRPSSFETDLLEKKISCRLLLPFISNGYFIDIGTPDDYRRAQQEFSDMIGVMG
jgi:D-glycero-alpha-D-manno-heptose 1-phosphate guanylyltransferase